MAKVTIQQVKNARHKGCKWSEEDVEQSWARSGKPPGECELSELIASYIAAPAAEHRDRAYIVRQLLSSDQRRRVAMLHGPEPMAYMRRALAVVREDEAAAAQPAQPAQPNPNP